MNKDQNDEFYDLAFKVATRRDAPGEQADLNHLLSTRPELHPVYKQLLDNIDSARGVLELLRAIDASPVPLPERAAVVLRGEVARTFGTPKKPASFNIIRALLAFGCTLLAISLLGAIFSGGYAPMGKITVINEHYFSPFGCKLYYWPSTSTTGSAEIKSGWYYLAWTGIWTLFAAGALKFYDHLQRPKN